MERIFSQLKYRNKKVIIFKLLKINRELNSMFMSGQQKSIFHLAENNFSENIHFVNIYCTDALDRIQRKKMNF